MVEPGFSLRPPGSRLLLLSPYSVIWPLSVLWKKNGIVFYLLLFIFSLNILWTFPKVSVYLSMASFFMILLVTPSKRAWTDVFKWPPIVGHGFCITSQKMQSVTCRNWGISVLVFETLAFQLTHVPTLFGKQNRLHVARQGCWQTTPSCQIYTNPSPVYCTMS